MNFIRPAKPALIKNHHFVSGPTSCLRYHLCTFWENHHFVIWGSSEDPLFWSWNVHTQWTLACDRHCIWIKSNCSNTREVHVHLHSKLKIVFAFSGLRNVNPWKLKINIFTITTLFHIYSVRDLWLAFHPWWHHARSTFDKVFSKYIGFPYHFSCHQFFHVH
jgi:hypothetical protein